MDINDTPQKVRWDWAENTVVPEGRCSQFVCACGNVVIGDDEHRFVRVCGCGRPHYEVIECDECETTWRSEWVGITFTRADSE